MKDWFPFTDYDFYACLTAGVLIVASVDYAFYGGVLTARENWSVVQCVVWVAISYIVGQISAAPSAALLEHVVARRLFLDPTKVILGLNPMRKRERIVQALFAQFEYAPLAPEARDKITGNISKALGAPVSQLSGGSFFHIAFPVARSVVDTAARLDRFISLYGFARNVAFAALIAALVLISGNISRLDYRDVGLAALAGVIAIGMFGRFIKFYAAYTAEIFRTYGRVSGEIKTTS